MLVSEGVADMVAWMIGICTVGATGDAFGAGGACSAGAETLAAIFGATAGGFAG
jgi:hypothetical protein